MRPARAWPAVLVLFLAGLVGVAGPDDERKELLARAQASDEAAARRVRDDPDRPAYHLLPPAHWNNDPNGPIHYKGWYHVFYQHNPYGDGWGHMHWGHWRSRDLVTWEHLPIALWPSRSRGEEHVFSGCTTLTAGGRPLALYTSIGPRLPEQWAAVPEDDDLILWKKHPANPILTEKVHGAVKVHEWRDPFVFSAGGRAHLVLGGNLNGSKGGEAVVNVYRAEKDDLTGWKYLGVLFKHPDHEVRNIECPLFFPLGGRWVLVVSQGRPVHWFVGDLDEKAMRFTPRERGAMDYGDYYAPNCLEDAAGRRILWGWVQGFKGGRGWNGCLTLPRVLVVGTDGRLAQVPAPELQKLRGPALSRVADLRLAGAGRVLERVRGDTLELAATFEPGDAKALGLRVRRSEDGKRSLTIRADGKNLEVVGTKAPLVVPGGQKTLSLRVFLDRSVVEVYAGGLCVTRVVYPGKEDLGVEAFAEGGTATLRSLEAWPVGSIWAAGR
jgi:beta-fructofuranosidase